MRHVGDFPVLSISDLQRLHAWKLGSETLVSVGCVALDSPQRALSVLLRITLGEGGGSVDLMEGSAVAQRLPVSPHEDVVGRRRWAFDTAAGRSQKLYYAEGEFVPREALGVRYLDSRTRRAQAAKAKRDRAAAKVVAAKANVQLKPAGWYDGDPLALAALLAEHDALDGLSFSRGAWDPSAFQPRQNDPLPPPGAQKIHPSQSHVKSSEKAARAPVEEPSPVTEEEHLAVMEPPGLEPPAVLEPLDRQGLGPPELLDRPGLSAEAATEPTDVRTGAATEVSDSRPEGPVGCAELCSVEEPRPKAKPTGLWRHKLAERALELRVKVLRERGLLDPNRSATTRCNWDDTTNPEAIRVSWKASDQTLTFEGWHSGETVSVKVVRLQDSRGKRVYFECPLDGSRREVLYVYDGQVGSFGALGLKYTSQVLSKSAKRAMRRTEGGPIPFEAKPLLLSPKPPVFTSQAEAEPKPEAEAEAEPKPMRPRDNAFSTRAALYQARYLTTELLHHAELLLLAKADLHRSAARAWLGRPAGEPRAELSIGVLELQPRLEVRELLRAGLLVDGERRPAMADWRWCKRTALDTAAFYADLIDPDLMFLAVESVFDRSRQTQVIGIERARISGRLRYFFRCPITGDRVETLAYRAGLWASRRAQRLKHTSQRSERFAGFVMAGARGEWGTGLLPSST